MYGKNAASAAKLALKIAAAAETGGASLAADGMAQAIKNATKKNAMPSKMSSALDDATIDHMASDLYTLSQADRALTAASTDYARASAEYVLAQATDTALQQALILRKITAARVRHWSFPEHDGPVLTPSWRPRAI